MIVVVFTDSLDLVISFMALAWVDFSRVLVIMCDLLTIVTFLDSVVALVGFVTFSLIVCWVVIIGLIVTFGKKAIYW